MINLVQGLKSTAPLKFGKVKTSQIRRNLGKVLSLSAKVFETDEDIDKL